MLLLSEAVSISMPKLQQLFALQMFDLMDKDKGGSLGAEEVKQLMDMLGMKVGLGVVPLQRTGHC